ncbi:hypothetical protein BJX65DRAFT_302064 [Aspergillus insuetus]
MDLAKGRTLKLHTSPLLGPCTASYFSSDILSCVLKSISGLEVLHYDIACRTMYPGYSEYLSSFQSAIDVHKETLRELSLTANTVPLKEIVWWYLTYLQWPFAAYPKLTKLNVTPKVLPSDVPPGSISPPLCLPPHIESLTIVPRYFREKVHRLLELLARDISQFSRLKIVTAIVARRPKRPFNRSHIYADRGLRRELTDEFSSLGVELRFEEV